MRERAEAAICRKAEPKRLEAFLKHQNLVATVSMTQHIIPHMRGSADQEPFGVPLSHPLVADFEVHGVFAAEPGAPIPAMAIENRSDQRDAVLYLIVAHEIQSAFEVQIDRGSPGMIADEGGRPAHQARTQHAAITEAVEDLSLLVSDLLKNAFEVAHRRLEAKHTKRTQVPTHEQIEQALVRRLLAFLAQVLAGASKQGQHGRLACWSQAGVDA